MKLFLHICCGPCAAYPVKYLSEQGHELTGYFYNPNIHPYKEFVHRLDTLKDFAQKSNLTLLVDADYSLEEFLAKALQAPGERCRMCYELRLRKAAQLAKSQNYDAFTTTLLVSPYQKHEIIKEIGERIAKEENIAFYYADFRIGWKEGVAISRAMELYRQPYCGCIFSEKERYYKTGKEQH